MESVNVPKVLHDHVLGEMERVATYYLSERRFLATDDNQVRRFPEIMFSFLHRNSATATQFYDLPGERVVTIGTRIDL
jgi:KUP system potassium uptake protein